jgi:DNA gyrase inhibitor GyrI
MAMGYAFSEVKVMELPAMRVMSCRVVSAEPEDESIRKLGNWLAQHGMDIKKLRTFGFDSPISEAEAQAGMRGYEIGAWVSDEVKADDGIQERLYGGGLYAVVTVENAFEAPFESIPGGWKHLNAWVANSPQYRPACSLCYEEAVYGKTTTDLILYHHIKER